MNNYKHDFGKRFRAFRKAAGLTQKEVAEKLGISRSYVSRIEKKAMECLKEAFEMGKTR